MAWRFSPASLFSTWAAACPSFLLNFFWCSEKGKFAVIALISGLLVNVVINSWLIHSCGILGAAYATATAVATQFLVLWFSSALSGLRFDWRVGIVYAFSGILLAPSFIILPATALLILMTTSGILLTEGDQKRLFQPLR
ncbi:MAG: polysaccharide biosynthesis C-terminal domain-containing protein [Planctomycetota bacterium]|nr:polysaccharide biosynthesis C-terminal domain-containing protein [Planctomycetota bacterium]